MTYGSLNARDADWLRCVHFIAGRRNQEFFENRIAKLGILLTLSFGVILAKHVRAIDPVEQETARAILAGVRCKFRTLKEFAEKLEMDYGKVRRYLQIADPVSTDHSTSLSHGFVTRAFQLLNATPYPQDSSSSENIEVAFRPTSDRRQNEEYGKVYGEIYDYSRNAPGPIQAFYRFAPPACELTSQASKWLFAEKGYVNSASAAPNALITLEQYRSDRRNQFVNSGCPTVEAIMPDSAFLDILHARGMWRSIRDRSLQEWLELLLQDMTPQGRSSPRMSLRLISDVPRGAPGALITQAGRNGKGIVVMDDNLHFYAYTKGRSNGQCGSLWSSFEKISRLPQAASPQEVVQMICNKLRSLNRNAEVVEPDVS